MGKDGHPAAGHDDVWRAGQVAAMQPEAVARSKEYPAHDQLGLGVLALDASHHPAAFGGRDYINLAFVRGVKLAAR